MEIDRLEENLKELSVELTALKHITNGLDKKCDQQTYPWLEDVERIAGDTDEMQTQLYTLRRPYALNNQNGRMELDEILIQELQVKVIESLQTVQGLKEAAFEMPLLQITENKLKRYSHDDLIMFTSNFSVEIGFGGFSKVYRGTLSNGVQVAIKVLQDDKSKDVVQDIFVIEVSTMIKASHPNLIKLYGFCFDNNMKALVYEYMENGSLDKVLFKKHIVVDWQGLYEIAVGVAKVLAYLHHDCDDQIIHHDIKPANILLDSNLSPKVTDFGVAKIMNSDLTHFTMTRVRGTSCYIAPEMTMYASRVTYTCDVYSFGRTLFDILGMRIYSQTQPSFPNQVWHKFDKGKLDDIIKECGILGEEAENARILSMVALWCIQFTPEIRPSMRDVVNALERNLQVAAPPNPFLASGRYFSIGQSQDMTYSVASNSVFASDELLSITQLPQDMTYTVAPNQFLVSDELLSIRQTQDITNSVASNSLLASNELVSNRQSQDMTYSVAPQDITYSVGSASTPQSLPQRNSNLDNLQDWDAESYEAEFVNGSPRLSPEGSPETRHSTENGENVQSLPRRNSSLSTLKKWGKNLLKRNRLKPPETTLRQFSQEDIKRLTNYFSTRVSSDGYSNLYKGEFLHGEQILVRVMSEDDVGKESFEAEMKVFSVTSHRNIIKPYGFCFSRTMKAIVLEYMENGSLANILFENNSSSIPWGRLYHIATETAKGICYLHDGCDEVIIHRDIKPLNILLDSSFAPKLAKFGFTRLANRDLTHLSTTTAGTVTYMDPDMYMRQRLTYKSDVYSYGATLFEIFGRLRLFSGNFNFVQVCWTKFENGEMEEFLAERGFGEYDREDATILLMVAFWCVQFTPEARPPMKTVVMMLEKEKEVTEPPNPFNPASASWS